MLMPFLQFSFIPDFITPMLILFFSFVHFPLFERRKQRKDSPEKTESSTMELKEKPLSPSK
jgi:hypothetical protein